MAKKKSTKKKAARKRNEFIDGAYRFEPTRRGYRVRTVRGGQDLGEIVRVEENSGRVAYALGFDRRREPRSYRGKRTAAEALQTLADIRQQVKKIGLEAAIIRAWDSEPR